MFIYACLVTHASHRLWLHGIWSLYVHVCMYELLCVFCVCVYVRVFVGQKRDWNFITEIRNKIGYCETSWQSQALFREWQMMTIQKQFRGDVGSARRSKAIIPTVLSVRVHTQAHMHKHTQNYTSSETYDLCICRVVKICQNGSYPPSCTQSFFYALYILSFSPAVTNSQRDGQIWTDISWACAFL